MIPFKNPSHARLPSYSVQSISQTQLLQLQQQTPHGNGPALALSSASPPIPIPARSIADSSHSDMYGNGNGTSRAHRLAHQSHGESILIGTATPPSSAHYHQGSRLISPTGGSAITPAGGGVSHDEFLNPLVFSRCSTRLKSESLLRKVSPLLRNVPS